MNQAYRASMCPSICCQKFQKIPNKIAIQKEGITEAPQAASVSRRKERYSSNNDQRHAMQSVERANQINTEVQQGISIQGGDEFRNRKAAKPYRASTSKKMVKSD
jgi:hypothetical protein